MLRDSRLVRRLTLVLALVLFASFLVIAFHRHDDDGDHNDCPVCAVIHHMSSTVFNSFSFAIFLVIAASSPIEKAASHSSPLVSILFGRAPPA